MSLLLLTACAPNYIAFPMDDTAGTVVDTSAGGDTDTAADTDADTAADTDPETGTGTPGRVDPSDGPQITPWAGWFGAPVAITPTSGMAADLKTGDFNGDGLPDVSVSTSPSGSWKDGDRPFNIELSLTDGAGGFTPVSVPTALLSGYTLVTDVADLDGDGDADLVAAHSGGVSVFFSDGTTLATQVDYTGLRVGAVELGDVDGDGDSDLLALDDNGDLNLWANDGRGNFSLVQALPAGGGFVLDYEWDSIDLVDLDLDGALDVVVLIAEGTFLGVDPMVAYLNDGAGTFDTTAWSTGPTPPYDIALGDIDGEGHVDIVYAGMTTPTIESIAWDSGYGAVTSWPISSYGYQWVLTGDVDGDGDTDAVGTVGFDVGVSLQDAGALVDQGVAYPMATTMGWLSANDAIELVDMNGDGCADVVAALYGVGTSILPATGPNCTGDAPKAWTGALPDRPSLPARAPARSLLRPNSTRDTVPSP
jgi:hypothetical protein